MSAYNPHYNRRVLKKVRHLDIYHRQLKIAKKGFRVTYHDKQMLRNSSLLSYLLPTYLTKLEICQPYSKTVFCLFYSKVCGLVSTQVCSNYKLGTDVKTNKKTFGMSDENMSPSSQWGDDG